jgi:hypothetical protein
MAVMTIADIKQSALAHRNVKLVPELPSGPSQYERLGTHRSLACRPFLAMP